MLRRAMGCYRQSLRDACAALLLAAASAAWAAPDAAATASPPAAAPDPVLQLLQSKGLLPADAQSDARAFARQVRDKASDLVLSAMNFIGVPYRWGGESASEGFDCSGFTRHVFESSLGLVLPRRATEQAHDKELIKVGRNELKPGDLVFFNTMRRAFSHVGIYVGDGKFIHAPRRGSEVRVDDMRSAYWVKRFNGARRAVHEAMTATATQLSEAAPPSP
jgi:cell wall-associated NlpC family hydrolase